MGIMIEKITESTAFDPKSPLNGDYVTVHYVIKTLSGMTIVNTRDRNSHMCGEPFRFRLGCGSVIKGIDQGLLKINVGDHARFIISPDLCYGSKGFYPLIPANAALIVQIELLEAEPSNPNAATLGATVQDKKTHEHVF